MKDFDLSGQVALITGSAGLLGIQHAYALLECNAITVLTDSNGEALATAKEFLLRSFPANQIYTFKMDVTEESSIEKVRDRLNEIGLNVSILINNAAINPKVSSAGETLESSRLENFPVDSWDLQMDVGLKGAFLCSKVFGTRMAALKIPGVILNISSDLSISAPDQRLYRKPGIPDANQPVKPVTYSVIKAGLIGLTLYLSTYWSNLGIRCNALSPGGVYVDQNEEFVRSLEERIPLGRMASPSEYKCAIQFLCSSASRYMTGQNIVIDGGRSAW